jgi:hypothetical protein
MISPSIDAPADSDIMPAPRRKTLARKRTMNEIINTHKLMRKTTGHFDVIVSLIHAGLAAGFTYADIDEMEREIYR